jgi:hypothetical protein
VARRRTPAEAFRDVAEVEATASRLRSSAALAIGASDDALRALEAIPGRRRSPPLVLAALRDLALAGRAPDLANALTDGDADAVGQAAVTTLVVSTDAVAATLRRRQLRNLGVQRCAVLHPAVTEAAHRAGAERLGLVDLGASGLNLHLDRVGVTYDDGLRRGDQASPVQLSCAVVGPGRVPPRAFPPVVARVRVDRDPVDVTDADDVRWLRACVWPDQEQAVTQLEAGLAVAAAEPPILVRDDPLEALPDAVARVPGDAVPVVTTTWALSQIPRTSRPRFLDRLADIARDRAVAWVSVEGVGVAPEVPTFGDRPASGHSIIGVTLLEGSSRRVEAVGRCWSRGRIVSWLAGA